MSKELTIAIIGASFAGLRAYINLRSKFPEATIYLFDKEKHFTFIPSFHVSLCKQSHLKNSQLSLEKHFGEAFINETVIKLNNNSLETFKKSYSFDFAVVATGAQVNYFGNKSLEKHAMGAKSVPHMKKLWERLPDAKKIVIIGGGLSGVEFAAMLASTTDKEITLINSTDRLVPNLSLGASAYVHKYLATRGVKVFHETRAESATENSVSLSSGEKISTDLILMCTGLYQQAPFIASSKLTPHLCLEDCGNIFFCGDVAKTDKVPTAHSAMIEGDIVSQQIIARVLNKEVHSRVIKKQTTLAVGLGPSAGFIAFKSWYLPLPFTGLIKLYIEKSVLLSYRFRLQLYV